MPCVELDWDNDWVKLNDIDECVATPECGAETHTCESNEQCTKYVCMWHCGTVLSLQLEPSALLLTMLSCT